MSPDQANLLVLSPLDTLPLWVIFFIAVVVLLLASEVGYRLSRYLQARRPDKAEASVGALNGATLALLAFLLAFVTSSAVSSFSARRQAVVDEANAIGTTYLRAGYLPEPYSTESRQLLREYVATRLQAIDPSKIPQVLVRSEEIHNQLWMRVEGLAKESSSPTLALYISALNEVIDLHTDRVNVALVARLPWSIVLGLFLMAVLALGLVGLHAGYSEKRNPIALLVFVLTLSVVFLLIVDLGRGDTGLLQVSHQALLDLQRQIQVAP
jgi:hypothetical protein